MVKINSVALVRERTIPTERPPPVGEVSANFCGSRGVTWSVQRAPTAVNLFSRPEPLLLYSSSSSVDLTRHTRLSGPRSRPTTTQKNLVAPGIEPETSVSVARTLTTRPQRRSCMLHTYYTHVKLYEAFSTPAISRKSWNVLLFDAWTLLY